MAKKNNKLRVRLILTLIWFAGVAVFSFPYLDDDYEGSIRATTDMYAARLESDLEDCIEKNSPSARLKIIHECSVMAESRCNGASEPGVGNCTEREYEACRHYILPECRHVFDNAQKADLAALGQPAWKWKLERVANFVGYSDWLWLALALLAAGPLCFWLLPGFVRRLHGWLYR